MLLTGGARIVWTVNMRIWEQPKTVTPKCISIYCTALFYKYWVVISNIWEWVRRKGYGYPESSNLLYKLVLQTLLQRSVFIYSLYWGKSNIILWRASLGKAWVKKIEAWLWQWRKQLTLSMVRFLHNFNLFAGGRCWWVEAGYIAACGGDGRGGRCTVEQFGNFVNFFHFSTTHLPPRALRCQWEDAAICLTMHFAILSLLCIMH